MILTARGEFTPPWPAEAVTMLSLERLAPDEVAELVQAAVGGATVPQPLLDQVVQRADGVPLFVEEVARELVESGALSDATPVPRRHPSSHQPARSPRRPPRPVVLRGPRNRADGGSPRA